MRGLIFKVVALVAILVDDARPAAVAYIYRRDNGGTTRVIQVGEEHLQLPFTLPHQLAEQWKVFEDYKLRPNAIEPYKDNINGILRPVIRNVKNTFFATLPLVPPWDLSDDLLKAKLLRPVIAFTQNAKNQDGKNKERSLKKYVEIKNLTIQNYGKINTNIDEQIHPVHEDTEENRSNASKEENIISDKKIVTQEKKDHVSVDRDNESLSKDESDNIDDSKLSVHHPKTTRHQKATNKTCKSHHARQDDKEKPDKVTEEKDFSDQGKTEHNLNNNYYNISNQHSDNKIQHHKAGNLDDIDYSFYESVRPYKIDPGSNFGKNYLDYNRNSIEDNKYEKKGDPRYRKEDYIGFHNENIDANNERHRETKSKQDGRRLSKQNENKGRKSFGFVKKWNTGYDKQWDRDEHKKDHDFYDDADKTGWNRKGNRVNIHNEDETSIRSEEEKYGSTSDKKQFGSSNSHGEKTIDDDSDHNYSANKGDEVEYKDSKEFKKNVGNDSGKKYGYAHEEDND